MACWRTPSTSSIAEGVRADAAAASLKYQRRPLAAGHRRQAELHERAPGCAAPAARPRRSRARRRCRRRRRRRRARPSAGPSHGWRSTPPDHAASASTSCEPRLGRERRGAELGRPARPGPASGRRWRPRRRGTAPAGSRWRTCRGRRRRRRRPGRPAAAGAGDGVQRDGERVGEHGDLVGRRRRAPGRTIRRWAGSSSAKPPVASAELPVWMPGARPPSWKCQHRLKSPASQAGHTGSMPRTSHDSHGLSTTRWPGSTPASGPASSTVATTSWPSTCGNEMNAVIGESPASSKSMRTCLVSQPQMPVRRVRSTAQPGPAARGRARRAASIGVAARWRTSRGASGGGCGRQRVGELAEDERLHAEPSSAPSRRRRRGRRRGRAVFHSTMPRMSGL